MKKALLRGAFFIMSILPVVGHTQTTYDSKTLVDTNNTSTSTSTVNTTNNNTSTSTSTSTSTVNSTNTNTNTNTSTNTNHNINSGTQTLNNNNNNVMSGTVTYNNNNVNSGTMTYNNNNVSTSTATTDNTNRNVNNTTSNNVNTNIQQGEVTNRNINDNKIEQRVISPPPTAIAPAMMSGGNNDLCTTGTSGAVQTQILGVSAGGTVRDLNCERLKLSKTLFDMGMKVAAVATMCQDRRVFDAMWAAGTPCPFEGEIGQKAKAMWEANPDKWPKHEEIKTDDTYKKIGIGALMGAIVYKLFSF